MLATAAHAAGSERKHAPMKVILLHEVPGLGRPGDVKEVAPGYARNYLLPRQLVTPATPSQLATLNERVAAAQRHASRERQTSEDLSARIAAVVLTFAVRVGQGDRLYGSVTSQDIASALQEQEDLVVDRRLIHLREPLRQLGEFEVGVRIATGREPKLKVRIISTEEAARMQGAGPGAATAEGVIISTASTDNQEAGTIPAAAEVPEG
jgi:large subunit ribosomal protein L9